MRVIILAGGKGTRLANVSGGLPKPMIPVAGRPFLTYILDRLPEGSDVMLCVGYNREYIIDFFGHSYKSLHIEYSAEETPLGTGGAVLKAIRRISNENVCIINGDTLFDINFGDFMDGHIKSGADVTLALKPMQNFDRYGTVTLDNNIKNKITSFLEKKTTEYGLINGGIYALNKKSLLRLNQPDAFSLEKDLFEKKLSYLNIFGIIYDSFFIDIGIPEDLERANSLLS